MKNNLIPGKKIPSLEVNTLNDTLWSIDDYLDKAKYMIVFYRGFIVLFVQIS